LNYFLERAASVNRGVETAGGRAANNSLHDACTRLKIVRNNLNGEEVAARLHRRACTGASAFFAMSVLCTKTGVFKHHCIFRFVRYTDVLTSAFTFAYTFAYAFVAECANVLVRAVCSLALGAEGDSNLNLIGLL